MIVTKKISSCLWCNFEDISKPRTDIILTRDFNSGSDQIYKYVKCASCNSLNLLEQPIESELIKIYVASAYDPYKSKRKVVANETDKRLSSCLDFNRNLKILDYGAGSGDYLHKMSIMFPGAVLYAVDFDVDGAKRRLSDLDVTVISPIQYMNEAHEFDHINISHCLEHLHNPVQVFNKLADELNTGGILIIRTPVADSVSLKIFQGYWFGLEAPRHFTVPSRKIFEKFLPSNFKLTLLTNKFYDSPVVFMRSVNYCIPKSFIFRELIIKSIKLIVSNFSELAFKYKLSSKAEYFYRKN